MHPVILYTIDFALRHAIQYRDVFWHFIAKGCIGILKGKYKMLILYRICLND